MYHLHDAEIVGLTILGGVDESMEDLVLTVRSETGQRRTLHFRGTGDWVLSPFGTQNVILDFFTYDRLSLTEHIMAFHDVPPHWAAHVRSGAYQLFAFTASVGMEGVVLANGLSLDEEG